MRKITKREFIKNSTFTNTNVELKLMSIITNCELENTLSNYSTKLLGNRNVNSQPAQYSAADLNYTQNQKNT